MELSKGVTAIMLGTKCSKTAFAATNIYQRSQAFISDKLENPTDDTPDQYLKVFRGCRDVSISISTNKTLLTNFKTRQ